MPRNALMRLGGGLLAVFAIVGLAAPWLAPYSPTEQYDAVAGKHLPPLTAMAAVELEYGQWRLADRVERTAAGLTIERLGRTEHYDAAEVKNLTDDGVSDRRVFFLGSDKFGRDVLSRLVHGTRISLTIGLLSVALSTLIGVTIGAAAALGGPIADSLLMRLVDGFVTIPWIFLLITLSAIFVPDTQMLIVLLGMTAWPGTSRLTRAELLSIRERDFVHAARGIGMGEAGILLRHMLPHVMTPLLVSATLRIGTLIMFEASLSFLGFGVPPPEASWGNMIADGQGFLTSAWWVATFPALALIVAVVAINLVGDGLRDALDPRTADDGR